MRQPADAESPKDRAQLAGVREQRRGGAGAVGQEGVEEADPEIGDERDADRPQDLRPEHRAHRTRERKRDKIRDERREAGNDGGPLAALKRPPDERAHDHDFQPAHRLIATPTSLFAPLSVVVSTMGSGIEPRNIAV